MQVEGFSGGDRVRLGIPRVQEALLQQVSALGKPVVLVLLNGSAVAVNWARDHVPAIVELWYPGQAGGTALADVLFGDYNPAGRLPVTFYKSEDQLPPFDDYSMKGRTYRYFEGEPLYPFGYGLSYTAFTYRNLRAPEEARAGSPMTGLRGRGELRQARWRRGSAVICEASGSGAGVAGIRARAAAGAERKRQSRSRSRAPRPAPSGFRWESLAAIAGLPAELKKPARGRLTVFRISDDWPTGPPRLDGMKHAALWRAILPTMPLTFLLF